MKKISIAVAVLLFAGIASGWAMTNAFVVSITGMITQADGTKVAIKDLHKGVSGLVTPTNNILVAIISQDDNVVEIDEVDPLTTNIVGGVAASGAVAILDSGVFNADLAANGDGHHGAVTNVPAGVPQFTGDLQASGKVHGGFKSSTTATLSGVWNDPVNGNSGQPAAIFKGNIKSTGTNAVPPNCCLSF